VFVRTSTAVDAFEFDPATASFGDAPLFTIWLPGYGTSYYGVEQIALDPTETKIYFSLRGGLYVFSAEDGTHLSTMANPDLQSPSSGICVSSTVPIDCVPFTKQDERILAINGAPCGPPAADAGFDMQEECTSPAGNPFVLDGSASTDPSSTPGTNDDIALFEWFEDYGLPTETLLGVGELLNAVLPLGTHAITLRVTDSFGEADTDEISITVVDTTAPQVLVGIVPGELWPPNHHLVQVGADTNVIDACSEPVAILNSVSSSEPDDQFGNDDGNTADDIQEAAIGTADYLFRLRAERSGSGPGRRYTAIYAAMDGAGNIGTAASFVDVRHDQGGATDPIRIDVTRSPNGTLVSWSQVEGAHHYSVIRGDLININETSTQIGLGPVFCVESRSVDATTQGQEDRDTPGPGQGFFYLVEYFDGVASSYGTESTLKPRIPGPGSCE
jgi:hypothetical protein